MGVQLDSLTSTQHRMIAKCCVALLLLASVVLCDQSGYSAPASSGYAAPQYATGGGSGYDAPDSGYGAPTYDYSSGYQQDEGGLDLSKLEELLPLFVAVLGAIILAKLLAPFLVQLFALIVGLLPMGINLKAPIINAILLPFGLTLCDPTGPTVFPAAGRGFGESLARQIIDDVFATIRENMQ